MQISAIFAIFTLSSFASCAFLRRQQYFGLNFNRHAFSCTVNILVIYECVIILLLCGKCFRFKASRRCTYNTHSRRSTLRRHASAGNIGDNTSPHAHITHILTTCMYMHLYVYLCPLRCVVSLCYLTCLFLSTLFAISPLLTATNLHFSSLNFLISEAHFSILLCPLRNYRC